MIYSGVVSLIEYSLVVLLTVDAGSVIGMLLVIFG